MELAFSIPPRYKFRWKHDDLDTSGLLFSDEISEVFDTPKISLKRTFEDQLPHDFLYRRKKGFRVRLIDWFGSIFRD